MANQQPDGGWGDGKVWAWGFNNFGQLRNGTFSDS
ncbi:hypothetical protein [Arthrobacter sp. NPDC058127]